MALDQIHEQNNSPIKGIGGASHQKHHEDNTSFRTRFIKDVGLLVAGFTVNHFEVSDFTPINNTAVQFNDEVRENIRLVPQIGEEQFLKCWNDRLIRYR